MIEWKEKAEKPAFVFGTLKLTDTFLVDYDVDNIFMKIKGYDDDDTNAVSLKKGTPHNFPDTQIVTPIHMIIEYSLRT